MLLLAWRCERRKVSSGVDLRWYERGNGKLILMLCGAQSSVECYGA